MTGDSKSLARFLEAQVEIYPIVLDELRSGQKRSHWMWFIFPQLRGLGSSPTSVHYGIASRQEAQDYLSDPILGSRLLECTQLVLNIKDRTAFDIFGTPDDLKFQSCMSLFQFVDPAQQSFSQALDQFFAGQVDARTKAMLEAS